MLSTKRRKTEWDGEGSCAMPRPAAGQPADQFSNDGDGMSNAFATQVALFNFGKVMLDEV